MGISSCGFQDLCLEHPFPGESNELNISRERHLLNQHEKDQNENSIINKNDKIEIHKNDNERNKDNKNILDKNNSIDLFKNDNTKKYNHNKKNKEMKVVKANSIEFKNNKSKNKDNNGSYVKKNNDNDKLFEEFLKKENDYKLKIKELEKIIANYKEPILIGLNNIGATCYMNATLQCLSNTKKLTDYFLNIFKNDDPNKIMSNEYYKVIKNLWNRENNNKSYSPNSFKEVLSKENPLFEGVQANDSKDLINFLIERFHQELNVINININNINNDDSQINPDQTNEQMMFKIFLDEFTEKFNSPISNLFYGILETKSQCKGCNIIKYNFQVYSFLEFPLQQVNQFFYNKGKRPLVLSNGKNPDVDIYECFEYNMKIDLMTGENQMHCNICNRLCDAYYSTIIYSFPNYLIINLNRGKGATYECNVIFPEQLNVINYATFKQGITAYELYAVICHLGPSSMSGHFVAYCKNSIDHKWYLYNDAIVTQCKREQQYKDGMPYILFYKASMEGT